MNGVIMMIRGISFRASTKINQLNLFDLFLTTIALSPKILCDSWLTIK